MKVARTRNKIVIILFCEKKRAVKLPVENLKLSVSVKYCQSMGKLFV